MRFRIKNLCFVTLVLCSAFAGCNQSSDHHEKSEKVSENKAIAVERADTICFERYSGLKKQDTASVRMIISGNQVHGNYSNFPYQKDARIGKITGEKSGNKIKGVWRYIQEGMTDSIPFEFQLEGKKMLQKNTSFNVTTGRETLSDTSSFSVLFEKVDCKNIDYRMHIK
jgi:hypothetical protein